MDKQEKRREHIKRLGQRYLREGPEEETAAHRDQDISNRKRVSRMPFGDAVSSAFHDVILFAFDHPYLVTFVLVFFGLPLFPILGLPLTLLTVASVIFIGLFTLRYFERFGRFKINFRPRLWFKRLCSEVRPFWVHLSVLVIMGLAFVEWREYGIYTLIRFVCCAAFVRLSWSASRVNHMGWVWVWGTLAAAYNPFVPLNLGRDVWVWVNWGTIAVILADVIHLSPSPWKTVAFVSKSIALVVLLFGIFVGGRHYFFEVLPEQQAKKAAKKKELEEQRAEKVRERLDALYRDLNPSFGKDIEPIPRLDYYTDPYQETWEKEETRKKNDDN